MMFSQSAISLGFFDIYFWHDCQARPLSEEGKFIWSVSLLDRTDRINCQVKYGGVAQTFRAGNIFSIKEEYILIAVYL